MRDKIEGTVLIITSPKVVSFLCQWLIWLLNYMCKVLCVSNQDESCLLVKRVIIFCYCSGQKRFPVMVLITDELMESAAETHFAFWPEGHDGSVKYCPLCLIGYVPFALKEPKLVAQRQSQAQSQPSLLDSSPCFMCFLEDNIGKWWFKYLQLKKEII